MKRKFSKRTIASVAAVLVVLSVVTFVFAKYLLPVKSGYKQAEASEFCLTTSLSENDAEHPYLCSKSISFTVNNNDGLNISENDIDFNVSISGAGSDSASIRINDVDTAESTLNASGTDLVQKNVVISGLSNGDYTVTVSSTAPFEKEIKLYFRATQGSQKSTYKVTQHDNWAELDVYTGSSPSDITVAYSGYSPDNTNDYMSDWLTDGPSTLEGFELNSHYKLVFFGEGSFSLEQDGETLEAL